MALFLVHEDDLDFSAITDVLKQSQMLKFYVFKKRLRKDQGGLREEEAWWGGDSG